MKAQRNCLLVLVVVLHAGASIPVIAGTVLSFGSSLDGNTTLDGSQFVVTVSDVAGQVEFKFSNNVGIASSITDIYIYDPGPYLTGAAVLKTSPAPAITDSGSGVDFSIGASPPQLPGLGGGAASAAYSAGSSNAPSGLDSASEWVAFTFDYQTGKVFQDVEDAIAAGTLRVGLKVQSIDGSVVNPGKDESDAYLSDGSIAPTPSAMLSVAGMIGLIAARRRRRG